MKFYWKAKGTADDHYNTGEFEAEDESAAQEWLDKTFAIRRNKKGEQTNSDLIDASLIDNSDHKKLQKIVADSTKKK